MKLSVLWGLVYDTERLEPSHCWEVVTPLRFSGGRITKLSVRNSPWILTKDPHPQEYCNLGSAVSPRPQSACYTLWLKNETCVFLI